MRAWLGVSPRAWGLSRQGRAALTGQAERAAAAAAGDVAAVTAAAAAGGGAGGGSGHHEARGAPTLGDRWRARRQDAMPNDVWSASMCVFF